MLRAEVSAIVTVTVAATRARARAEAEGAKKGNWLSDRWSALAWVGDPTEDNIHRAEKYEQLSIIDTAIATITITILLLPLKRSLLPLPKQRSSFPPPTLSLY